MNELQIEEYFREQDAKCENEMRGWFDTSKLKPEKDHETVIVSDTNGTVYTAPGWIVRDFPSTHPYWMRIPKPPKMPGLDARKCQDKGEVKMANIIEKIKQEYNDDPNYGVYDGVLSRSDIEEILKLFAAKKGPEWVSVSDRLPDNDYPKETEVVTITKEGNIELTYAFFLERYPKGYTHWMPLPPLPDEHAMPGVAK